MPEPGRDSGASDRDRPTAEPAPPPPRAEVVGRGRERLQGFLARHGWLVAIAALYLYVFPYFPRIHSANELPRVYLVKAIVHDHTFAIDHGVRAWGATADVSPHAGHQYSNKAPGSSLLVVPVYAAVNLVAGEPSLAVTLWLCRVIAGVIPTLLFLLLLWRFLARFAPDPDVRRLVVIAYALGSMAMTYSLLYYSHQLAAICIASAWIFAIDAIDRPTGARIERPMFVVGVLAGAAPLVDYQAAFAGVPLLVYVVVRLARTRGTAGTLRALAAAAIGASLPIALLLWYHSRCFGGPLRTGYDASQTFAHFHQQGFLGISKLRSEAFWGSLFAADNGLFPLSPWLLLAIPGGVVLWRRDRATVLVASSIAVIFITFVSSIAFWRGGWGVGPRYITAMLPFLLPLVAALFARVQATAARELVIGALCAPIVSAVIVYVASSATFPYWPDSLKNPLYEVTFRLLADGAAAPNALGAVGVPQLASAMPFLVGAALLVGFAIRRVCGFRGLAAACLGGAAIIAAFALVPGTGPQADRAYTNTVYPAVTR